MDNALVPLEKPEQPEVHHPDGRIEHPWVRREVRDVYTKTIVVMLLAIVGLSCLHFYCFRRWFYDYEAVVPKHDMAAYRSRGDNALPAEPRLEQLGRLADDPRPNVYLRQQRAEQALDRYAPGDEKGYVQVPIDRAIEMLPERVKSRGDEAAVRIKSDGLVDAGESNSGRVLREVRP